MVEDFFLFFHAQTATMVDTEKKTTDTVTGPASAPTLPAKLFGAHNPMHKMIVIIFLFISFISSFAFADVSTDIPLENPIYKNIERLSNIGVFRDDIQSIRPITLDRLERMVDEVRAQDIRNETIEHDLQVLRHFLDLEYKKNTLLGGFEITFLKSNARPTENLQTDSYSNPLLNTKDQGKFQWQSDALWIQPRLSFNWDGWAAFDLQPSFGVEENGTSQISEGTAHMEVAQLKLGHNDLEISAGRMPIQWGQGISGGLTFGGSQKSLNMIQIRNSNPMVPPSFLKFLGPTQFSGFVAQLDDNQVYGKSLVIGERGVIKPLPILEMGFTQSIQLAGDGAPNLSFVDVVSEVAGRRLQDIFSVNLTNRNFSADLSIQIPQLHYMTIYTEVFFEDCCKTLFTRDASKLIGLKFPDLWKSTGALSMEYVLTTEIYNRHGRYTSGFVNRGYPMGHLLGPDAQGYYLRYHHVLNSTLELDWVNAYEMRARNELDLDSEDIRNTIMPTFQKPEERIRSTVKFEKKWSGNCWTAVVTGYQKIWNSQFQQDENKNNYLVRIDHGFSF